MKTLLLLRHAKSDWGDDSLSDHDRPLSGRGKRDAPRIGRLIAAEDLVPDSIVSSTAARAATTAKAVARSAGFEGKVRLDNRLYHADPETFLEVAAEAGQNVACLMLVGHNPGLEELVAELSGRDELLPTAALACFRLDIPRWQDLDLSSPAELVTVWRPREL